MTPPPARRPTAPVLLLLAAAALGGCGGSSPGPPPQLAAPLRLSGASPYPAGCNPAPSGQLVYLGAEVEPHLAIDPADPRHLVAAWQQDRWRGGGANGIGAAASFDGGRTWDRAAPALTVCSGGGAGAWQRVSDPWVAVAADGSVLLMALAFDNPWSGARSAMIASRSTDGGRTWGGPVTLAEEASPDLTLDKNTLTIDPTRPGVAYAVWDRLEGLTGDPAASRGPAWMARTTDGGITWEAPWILYDPGADAQTISSQIVVQPDGALVNVLVVITGGSAATPVVEVAALRSVDAGLSWSGPHLVSGWGSVGVVDPLDGHRVRSGDIVPTVAVDRGSGALYAAWQDGRFGGGVDAIALSRSLDGGVTWEAPWRASAVAGVPAFTPALAVADSGRLGLGYYDLRVEVTGSGPGLWTTRWLATSADGGLTWTEAADGGPFDLRQAPDVPGYFLGDYAGLVAGADAFTSLFAMTRFGGGADRTDVFIGPPQP